MGRRLEHLKLQRRVCGRDLRHSVVTATESYVHAVHKPYIALCQGHRLCSTYKTVYAVAYRQTDVSRGLGPRAARARDRPDFDNDSVDSSVSPVSGGFSLAENVTEEVQSLRDRVELLEKKLQLVLAPFSSVYPLSLDEGVSEKTTLLSHSFQQLDRIDSLSEQIGFLEERLGTCDVTELLVVRVRRADAETEFNLQRQN
ncbi:hypothetical protein F2P81_016254 [Scophthalmus maximus]|uniref:EMI domain-containing protein n=1 Tax=Scophthalmus maximus TaxID=52904 RepID=A0A6A4SGR5_SCOMX|nr:hypothetical protein F2P81_016254 [Scophthalmus maximus]